MIMIIRLITASSFNIVVIKDGVLHTPARGVLEGITRKSVIDAAKAHDLKVKVDFVPVDIVYHADEVFMCTTAGGIMPITVVDDKPVGDGKIGAITKKIWDAYWAMHYDPAYSFAVTYDEESVKSKSWWK